jgi:chemotaxis signal transduction protein
MAVETFYLKLSNETASFQFAEEIHLGGFLCGVFEMKGEISPVIDKEEFFLCGNFIKESIFPQGKSAVLRRIPLNVGGIINTKFEKILWLPIN